MNYANPQYLDELRRIKRVADMMVTAHALLKERFAIFSLISDILLFSCAIILCLVTFAGQEILAKYFGSEFNLYIGAFSIIAIVGGFISNQLDWKVKAEKHKNAFERYIDVKFECNDILKRVNNREPVDVSKFLEKYYTVTPYIISIPEKLFLKCKRYHILKVFISKYLDEHPGSSILLLRMKLWVRDNCKFLRHLK